MGCHKLWARWPGTEHNIDLLQAHDHVDQKFAELWDELEHASFTITSPNEVIYLEPGDLHATVTLKGGLTPGIEYFSADSVLMTYAMWRRENLNPTWFLYSCDAGLRFPDSRLQTAKILCSAIRKHPELVRNDTFKALVEREENENKSCSTCNNPWAQHSELDINNISDDCSDPDYEDD